MNYTVVAYYTVNTPYEKEVKNLKASLDHFQLPYDIVGIKTQGSWLGNTLYKPYFLMQMIEKHFPKDILYLDADAVIRSHPMAFDDFKEDIGVVVFQETKEVLSNMLYICNNPKMYEIIDRWIALAMVNQKYWDQKLLQHLLFHSIDLQLKIHVLPHTYSKLDLMHDKEPAVIEQFQASRRFKKDVG